MDVLELLLDTTRSVDQDRRDPAHDLLQRMPNPRLSLQPARHRPRVMYSIDVTLLYSIDVTDSGFLFWPREGIEKI